MANEHELRRRITARAREALTYGVQADVRGEDGYRKGWQYLQRYFSVAPSCGSFDNIRKWTARKVKNEKGEEIYTHHIAPDWCGIFALWCLHAARPEEYVGYWVNSLPIQHVSGVEPIPRSRVQPGDVGIKHGKTTHHVVITEVIGDPPTAFRTIEGNWGPPGSFKSEVGEPPASTPVSDFFMFTSIFAADSEEDVAKRLAGSWAVTVDWKPWIYVFTKAKRVSYAEKSTPKKLLGSGIWATDGKKLTIVWESSQEFWDLPLPHFRQSATGTWRNHEGRTVPVTYQKIE